MKLVRKTTDVEARGRAMTRIRKAAKLKRKDAGEDMRERSRIGRQHRGRGMVAGSTGKPVKRGIWDRYVLPSLAVTSVALSVLILSGDGPKDAKEAVAKVCASQSTEKFTVLEGDNEISKDGPGGGVKINLRKTWNKDGESVGDSKWIVSIFDSNLQFGGRENGREEVVGVGDVFSIYINGAHKLATFERIDNDGSVLCIK